MEKRSTAAIGAQSGDLTQSWEECSAIREVSLEEVTPELILEDST